MVKQLTKKAEKSHNFSVMDSTRIPISTDIQKNVNAKTDSPDYPSAESINAPSWHDEMINRVLKSQSEKTVVE